LFLLFQILKPYKTLYTHLPQNEANRHCAYSAWDFLTAEKPSFDIIALNPLMTYGPLAHTLYSVDQLNESNSRIYKQYVNSKKDAPLPPNGLHAYVDVRVCMLCQDDMPLPCSH
jgi:hypothetical protein